MATIEREVTIESECGEEWTWELDGGVFLQAEAASKICTLTKWTYADGKPKFVSSSKELEESSVADVKLLRVDLSLH